MARLPVLLLAALLVPLAGCFKNTATIFVNKDGSGTIYESLETIPNGMTGFGAMIFGSEAISEEAIANSAEAMGGGAELVSFKKYPKGLGFLSIISFTDISELSFTPAGALSSGTASSDFEQVNDPLQFDFERGTVSTLTVVLPEPAEGPGAPQSEQTPEERERAVEGIERARGMFGGMSYRLDIRVAGDVVDSDAHYRAGSIITLIDFSFDGILDLVVENPELMGTSDIPLTRIRELAHGRDNLRFEDPGQVVTRFR